MNQYSYFFSGVQLGGECWSSVNGVSLMMMMMMMIMTLMPQVAAGGCDAGTQCGPWAPETNKWDGSSPWYCLAFPRLQSGATCDYANKVVKGKTLYRGVGNI